MLSHARNTEHDGYQVFCEEGGTFGAVFLVHSNEQEQQLRATAGQAVLLKDKIPLSWESSSASTLAGISFPSGEDGGTLTLTFPRRHGIKGEASGRAAKWQQSEGRSLWFQSDESGRQRGGRISPNEEDLDLEYWWQDQKEGIQRTGPVFTIRYGR